LPKTWIRAIIGIIKLAIPNIAIPNNTNRGILMITMIRKAKISE
jgi:hypothetical protein